MKASDKREIEECLDEIEACNWNVRNLKNKEMKKANKRWLRKQRRRLKELGYKER